jgi:uncharacterized protein YndB with AHSA1/START domain
VEAGVHDDHIGGEWHGMSADAVVHDRDIVKEVLVAADRHDVWQVWTTSEGARTFFAPEANIVLEVGGPYELFFDTEATEGSRGSEGMKILRFVPEEMLSFEWNAPPRFVRIRRDGPRTWVVVRFEDADGGATRVRLAHLGWREGGQWDEVHAYFDRAWGTVLDRLTRRFESGPIDWNEPDST